ncbi:MAG TPA: MMPL family transporter [Candidatus Limnocylindrales bacterium]|nr:MMPL family transporter [Candidatus Limnocylindrales bacterium]
MRTRPWTARVAAWSAAHRWPVFGLWFVVTIGIFVASIAAGGTNAADAVSNEQRAKFEAGEASVLFNASGPAEPASQQFLLIVSGPPGSATTPAFQAIVADAVGRMTALTSTVAGVSGPVFEQIADPTKLPPSAGLVSPDGSSVRIAARVPGDGDVLGDRMVPVPAMLDDLRAAHPQVRILELSNVLANREIMHLVNGGLDSSLRLTIPLTFLILLVAFGSVVAAVVPLVLAVTALLAAFGLLGLYSQLVSPVSAYASQLIVLIGLAVAVDYSLFMVTRFRTERRHGRPKLAAIDVASNTAGRAIFFSGLAVMISIAGLFLLDDPLFRSMAIGTIAVVLVAVIGSLTFLPATLAILGDGVSRLRIPILGRDREEGSGLWATVVRGVMRHPIIAVAVVAIGLLGAATPVLRLHLGQEDFGSFPDSLEAVQAVNLLNEKWPGGSTLDLDVVVTHADQPATQAAISDLTTRLLAVKGLSGPATTELSADKTVESVTVLMAGGSNDESNQAIVREVRGSIVPAVFGGLSSSGVRALVSGQVAYTLDVVDFYANGMPLVGAFVLGLSFILLLVAFRSIVIPIKAIILNLLSTGAAYGVLVFVFQDGHFSDLIGFKPGPIESFVPVFIFTILFGLSMDYHVFILTRIKEARDRGLTSNEAVARGIAITSGTITSAAAIMVVVFSVFVTLELTIIKQLGLGLAVAVFLDATVVRSLLLPATMRLLGDWNWWLPSWLEWLPRVTIEGGAHDDLVPGAEAGAARGDRPAVDEAPARA